MIRPGFIDLQINGYMGIDFNNTNTTVDDILKAAAIIAQNGTAGFLATVITSPRDVIEHNIATLAEAIRRQEPGGTILGIHLEGPFISPEYGFAGAHPQDCITAPDLDWFRKLQRIADGHLRLITLAPEHGDAVPFIRAVTPDVIVSAGHTNCEYFHLQAAVDAGMTMATHIGNGCRQQIDRHDNPIVNILATNEITCCFIPDSFHLPEAFIRMLINSRPIDKLIVVSDAVALAGLPPGEYDAGFVGGAVLLQESGRLCLASDPEVMAGSTANMRQCMNFLAGLNCLDEENLWALGHTNALRHLGLSPEMITNPTCGVRYDSSSRSFELVD